VLIALPSLVCAQQSAPTPQSNDVAARIGDRVISVRDVDESWRKTDPADHQKAAQTLYDGRKAALERMIADMLLERAAKAKGVSAEQYTAAEIAQRVKPVTDADVSAFFQQNQSRMGGRSIDELRPRIREFLDQQQQTQARNALIADLKKAGPPIEIALDPPRQPIAVASNDPARGGASAGVVLVEFSDYQ